MAGTTAEKLAATLASTIAIKNAIENKNVEVGDAPLREYAGLIDSIETGGIATLTGTATAAEVLTGKTFYSDDAKVKLTGAMVNQGAKTYTPSRNAQTIPAGYHNGSGKVNGDTNLVASNIKSGVSIFGTSGNLVTPATIVAGGSTFLTSTPSGILGYWASNSVSKQIVKQYQFRGLSGSVRISFILSVPNSNLTAYAQINSGTTHTTSSTSGVTFTEDLAIPANGIITVYAWVTVSTHQSRIHQVSLASTSATAPIIESGMS